MEFILAFFAALCISMVLVPVTMRFSNRLGLLDIPTDQRKIHEVPIPRSGGIAIAAGTLFPIFLWLPLEGEYLVLAVGALIIIVFGLADDLLNLSYRWKFSGQFLASLVLVAGGVSIDQMPFFGWDAVPVWISGPLTFFFIVGVTNAVNLSDGLDGLAAGTSLLSLALIALLGIQAGEPSIALIALALIGGLLGFLRFNTHPAQVFMGDTGSQFLGFVTAALAVMATQHPASAVSPMLGFLIVGLPILDTMTVMAIRFVRKRFIFSPDKSHIHHQFMRVGFRHYEAVAVLYALQFLLLSTAYLLRYESDILLLLVYGAFCSVIVGFIGWTHWSDWMLREKGGAYPAGKDRRNSWLRRLSWMHHYSYLVIQGLLTLLFLVIALIVPSPSDEFSQLAFVLAIGFLAAWLFLGRYSPNFIARLVLYSVALVASYSLWQGEMVLPTLGRVVDALLVILVLLLALAIRMTRKEIFTLDNQDYLVLVIVLLTPFLPVDVEDGLDLGHLILRAAVLLYAVEFVISRSGGKVPVLLFGSILCLLGFKLL